ncbi:MAG: hypothetical protein GWO20_17540 [Candidatus Korarchaeota archaeon]|nr:hypothetical protein [Candidatus Korarchaeota archaeon]NIU85150.1 hypothetical protein [Candidatus Thorarchaeota archaeon]NIW15202.1 hypothetical protein [Candidatus Thorarchaeota archaeon]NIW53183.1 hypothetical protein [Candidatus Korarchaeota archaeon]
MRKKTFFIGVGLLFLVTLFGIYLTQVWRPRTRKIIADTGTVKKIEGFLGLPPRWIILSKNGRYYDYYTVYNLPSHFRKSGQRIWFIARPPSSTVKIMSRTTLATTSMIEVLALKKANTPLTSLTLTGAGWVFFIGIGTSLFSLSGIVSLAWLYTHKQS